MHRNELRRRNMENLLRLYERDERLASVLRPPFRKRYFTSYFVKEFGGNFGCACLIILLPILVLGAILCSKDECSIQVINDNLEDRNILVALGFISSIVLIQVIVHGTGWGTTQYWQSRYDAHVTCYFNGNLAIIVTWLYLTLLEYFDILPFSIILDNYFAIAVISYIVAFMLALYINFRSHDFVPIRLLNAYAESASCIYNFWIGLERFPMLHYINVRMILQRYCSVTTVALLVMFIKTAISEPYEDTLLEPELVAEKYTVAVIGLMQFAYVMYDFIEEGKIIDHFEWNYDSWGYMNTVNYCLYPFYYTLITKFALENNVKVSQEAMAFIMTMYLVSFFVKLQYEFIYPDLLTNPLHPDLEEDVVSIYLLRGGWRERSPKVVRQLHLLGDFLMHLTFTLIGIVMYSWIAIVPLMCAFCVMHRAWRIDNRCEEKFGGVWQMYCEKSRYILIPIIW